MLLTNAEGRKRILKDAALILFAILMLVSIAVVISKFETGGHGTVYAVDSSSNEGSWQSQMCLTGVVTGVADMEKYSEATRLIRMDGAKGATLAGACGLDRRAIRKRQIASGTTKAKELGYYAQQTIQENQMSGEEYYTLLQIVEAEATGGDVMSKMMVAGVVLNRVKDSHFPDTIQEVVWQDDQFQPTSDGRIYSCSVTDSSGYCRERITQRVHCFFWQEVPQSRKIRTGLTPILQSCLNTADMNTIPIGMKQKQLLHRNRTGGCCNQKVAMAFCVWYTHGKMRVI